MRLSAEDKALLAAAATRMGVSQSSLLGLALRAYSSHPVHATEEHHFPFSLHVTCPLCKVPITLFLDIGTVQGDPGATIQISQEPLT